MKERISPEDMDFEIRFYEAILREKPDFIEALMALGDLYTKKKMNQEALEIDKHLAHLRPDDGVILYNLSCSYSLLNEINKALENIARAIAHGYDDIEYLEKDNDLVNLRKDRRFQRLLSHIKKMQAR